MSGDEFVIVTELLPGGRPRLVLHVPHMLCGIHQPRPATVARACSTLGSSCCTTASCLHTGVPSSVPCLNTLAGGTLFRALKAGRVTWYRRGLRIAIDVARGLDYLHRRR